MVFDQSLSGIGLLEDFPDLGLTKGHRLVAEGPVTDIHDLQNLKFPAHVSFFDTRNTVGLNYVCELFSITGFSLECLALDLMHVFDLGVLQRLIATIFRTLISRNFSGSRLKRAKAREVANLVALRRSLRCVKLVWEIVLAQIAMYLKHRLHISRLNCFANFVKPLFPDGVFGRCLT